MYIVVESLRYLECVIPANPARTRAAPRQLLHNVRCPLPHRRSGAGARPRAARPAGAPRSALPPRLRLRLPLAAGHWPLRAGALRSLELRERPRLGRLSLFLCCSTYLAPPLPPAPATGTRHRHKSPRALLILFEPSRGGNLCRTAIKRKVVSRVKHVGRGRIGRTSAQLVERVIAVRL